MPLRSFPPEDPVFGFLSTLDTTRPFNLSGSDVVELHHCNVQTIGYKNFTSWAQPKLKKAIGNLNQTTLAGRELLEEYILELLEQYGVSKGLCSFELYRPTVPPTAQGIEQATAVLEATQHIPVPSNFARLAIVIVAFKDPEQLHRLIDAIHLPHHYIIIHLDRRTDPDFQVAVESIAKRYSNIAILKFGSIVYLTDSVSMVNLRIMRWLVYDLGVRYDFHLPLGGAMYPLQDAQTLASSLKESSLSVWLGGMDNHVKNNAYMLKRRQLFSTRGVDRVKTQKLPRPSTLPSKPRSDLVKTIRDNMKYKSNSGNQGIYAYNAVKQLLDSSSIMELFAVSKYAQCCLEENKWVAALAMLDLQKQALEQASVFQVWRGHHNCKWTTTNAVLSSEPSRCFHISDTTQEPRQLKFKGDEMLDFLKAAKQRGILFARKFSSASPQSLTLIDHIRTNFHVDSKG
jgi:hypothetical protein